VNVRTWSVAVEGAQRQVELEHRTWWQRAIVRVDGVVVLDRSINLAIGYDRGIALDVEVGGHRLTVSIRATAELRPRYVYGLEVDGEVAGGLAGGTDRLPSVRVRPRPTLTGTVEQIIWASTLIGSVRGLATGHLAETATVVGAAALCSLVLHRRSLPTSWRLGAVALLYTASLLAVGLASGSFRDPRGF
jgi:hypothetical protein